MSDGAEPPAGSRARGSRNEETRRRNLSAILRTVHRGGPASRAELTRSTGLNRSTVGDLVAELVSYGYVFEAPAPEGGGVGRPSPIVTPHPAPTAFTVNPDVDAVVVGRVGLGGVVRNRVRVEVPSRPSVEQAAEVAARAIETIRAAHPEDLAVGVGIAVPGLVRERDHLVVDAPHLEWRLADVAAEFAYALDMPAVVLNDANAGLLAESRFGAAVGDDVVYLNGSASGIGGAVVLGGHLLGGANGFAGELGHTLANPNGDRCGCGRVGCFETEVSLARIAAAAGGEHLDPDRLGILLGAATSGPVAAETDRQVDQLAVAIANVISSFNPSVVVLAGFLGALMEARPERLERAFRREAFAELAADVRLVRATLKERRLLIGAAEMVFEPLLADPAGWHAAATD